MNRSAIHRIELAGQRIRRGKVRDIFDLGDRLLIVATDRISAFDCVLPDPIPTKGRILTELCGFWFDRFTGQYPHHLINLVRDRVPPGFESVADQIRGRSMLCRKARVIPIECVARGYLAGSGWQSYQADGTVCGISLPPGLAQSDRLPEPIFTPAIKAASGHDENISFGAACGRVGRAVMTHLRDTTLCLYHEASAYLQERGIILADTKFEFGVVDDGAAGEESEEIGGSLILIDEVLTPDSSRFWPAERYEPGRVQESFDKQFVRDALQRLCDQGRWNKTDPAPSLPPEIIEATRDRYFEAYRRITGDAFDHAPCGGRSVS
ncbi:MAG: phosphoribosylaminoimidazolesuccinocarboxamide synthase [Phycisphaerae bacterium]